MMDLLSSWKEFDGENLDYYRRKVSELESEILSLNAILQGKNDARAELEKQLEEKDAEIKRLLLALNLKG